MKMYSLSCEKDHVQLTRRNSGGKRKVERRFKDFDQFSDWAARMDSDSTVMCSSSMDFPEEYTKDKAIIQLCRDIRNDRPIKLTGLDILAEQASRKAKPCPICDAPALAIWKDYYRHAIIICSDPMCRCKVERVMLKHREAVHLTGPMLNALFVWNNR